MLSEAEILTKAEDAGWTYTEEGGWGTWTTPKGTRYCCSPAEKVAVLYGCYRPGEAAQPEKGFNHHHRCTQCKKPIWLSWMPDCEAELLRHKECFDCNYWMERVRAREAGAQSPAINSDYHCYFIGTRTRPQQFNGFGGQWWLIEFNDGRIVETCDLWSNGIVPERFRDRLKPNMVMHHGRQQPHPR